MAGGLFGFNMRAMSSAGLIPPNSELVTIYRKLWFYFIVIQYVLMTVLNLLYYAFKDELTFMESTIIFAQLAAAIQTVFRQFYFTCKIKEITSLVTELEDPNAFPEINELEFEMRRDSTKMFRRFSQYIVGFNTLLILTTIMHPIISSISNPSSNMLIVEIWFPWDALATPTFYYLTAWQVLALYTGFRTSSSTDAFACSLMLAVSRRCELLARAAPQALLPAANDTATTPYCKAWIKYHQHYIRLVADINELTGPVLLTTYFLVGLQITLQACLSVKTIFEGGSTVFCFTYLTMLMFRLFTFSYAGQQVQNKSLQLGRSVLGARQVARAGLKAGPMRTTLQVIMARCCNSKLEEINAMGYCTLDMDMFAAVLSACVSYILCLLQLKPRDT